MLFFVSVGVDLVWTGGFLFVCLLVLFVVCVLGFGCFCGKNLNRSVCALGFYLCCRWKELIVCFLVWVLKV